MFDIAVFEIKGNPAPCVHILAAGCTDIWASAPGVSTFFSNLLIPLYKEKHMDKLLGARFQLPMHPACA